MLTHFFFDFSWVLLFPLDLNYHGSLNALHRQLSPSPSYQPLSHFSLNQKLLNFLEPYSQKHQFGIFTGGEMHTLPALQPFLKPIFTHYFTESNIGQPKSSPAAFHQLALTLNTDPSSLFITDDNKINVSAASLAGCTAVHYQHHQQLTTFLSPLLR